MTKRLVTRRELAEKLAVHMQTVTKWEQAGMPIEEPGRRGRASLYDLAAVQKWRRQREKDAQQNGTVDLTRERARKERAQALVAEQTLAVRAGELVPRSQVEEVWTAEIAAVRAKLLAWPSTLSDRVSRAGELEGFAGVEKSLAAAVEELLLELSGAKEESSAKARPPKRKAKISRKKKRSKKATSSRKKKTAKKKPKRVARRKV